MENFSRALLLLFCLAMQAVTVGINSYAFGFFVVPWMTEFSVTRGELMLAVSSAAVVLLFVAPLGGAMADRFSSRTVVIAGALIFALGLALVSLAQSRWLIVAMFGVVLPVGTVLAGPLMAQTLAAQTFVHRRGLVLGIVALGSSIGGALMPMLVTTLLAHYHWRTVYLILSVLTLAAIAVPGALLLKNTRALSHGHHAKSAPGVRVKGDVLILGFAYFAVAAPFISVISNLGAYAHDVGLSAIEAAQMASIAFLASVVCKLGVGALADYVDERRIYCAISIAAAAGIALICNASSHTILGTGVLLSAAAAGGMMPLISAIVVRRYTAASFGKAIGFVHAFAALAGLASSFSAHMRDISGSYHDGFLWLLAPLLPAVLLFMLPSAKPLARQLQPEA